MDRPLRKYILYKSRNVKEMEKELRTLTEKKKDIIDSSPLPPDGMPHGKGMTSNPVESKVIRLEKINERIQRLQKEIEAIRGTRDLLDPFMQAIYDEAIIKYCRDMRAKADLMNMDYDRLRKDRGKILTLIAKRLGEIFEDDE